MSICAWVKKIMAKTTVTSKDSKGNIVIQVQTDWNTTDPSQPDFLKNKPAIIPQVQADMAVTDNRSPAYVKNNTGGGGGGTPQVNADWNAVSGVSQILNKPNNIGPGTPQVNADWNATSGIAQILNRPAVPGVLPTAMPTTTSLGILVNGTDQVTALNAAFANANYAGIIVDHPPGSVITLAGTLNCAGKTILFRPGTYFSGGGIDSAVLWASYQSRIFDVTVNITNCFSATEKVSIKWWGATDNAGDSQPAIHWRDSRA